MDIVYSHISTLYTLWKSLEVDPCTLNQKLINVIQELEKLIQLEKNEKILLVANIEDLIASIECASNQLGVSIEDMLQSTCLRDDLVYNDLQLLPTFPKYHSLVELNKKLYQEIKSRELHIHECLPQIESISKELDLPLKISCDLRDLRELKAQQSKEFEILVRNIQYYWQLLDYSVNTSDELEVTLHQLFEQFPLEPISITSAQVTFHIKDVYYYQHTNLPLSKNIISKLNEKKLELETMYKKHYVIYTRSVNKLKAVWDELQVPLLERPSIPQTLGINDMIKLRNIINNLEPFIKKAFEKYILELKEQLEPLWDACLVSNLEREEFIASLYEKNTKHEIKVIVDRQIEYLQSMAGKGKALMALMQERKDLIQKMIDFEKKASDPKRLFQASFQLLEEEKWRNSCLPRLLQLDRSLIKAIQEFEKLAGKPVMFGEKRYLDTLLEEIADREANQTFFGFLNTEPSKSTTTTTSIKRAKNSRPASVNSLGSMMKKQKEQQSKPRIMCPTSSQSMPLDKKGKKQQAPKDSKPTPVYNPSYIPPPLSPKPYNKNGRLTASMIPISTIHKNLLTTTKSI
ncbi:hypothetical protein RO3G_06655 [Rhizopus delemar RA 99-880]|uniref:Uncharacterized protein n=1 Tax=Rhizopus delemar (strain RA 99-880 / ATCC MYA-4621 / FGSC 9543 / NRRL 43880) TaxID=246409 RepID=I1C0H0_RHIO9|nr:hypothetical protein RO3G_06655 [Rhizopus delemar RA 99-880]|eukprot:EIE81950.1 hypothetical protein RO3G_06655 [Rhizopus delemar RA 99-880]